MIDNNKPYKNFTLAEKVDVAFYAIHQLFSYCLLVDDDFTEEDLNDYEIKNTHDMRFHGGPDAHIVRRQKDLGRGEGRQVAVLAPGQ